MQHVIYENKIDFTAPRFHTRRRENPTLKLLMTEVEKNFRGSQETVALVDIQVSVYSSKLLLLVMLTVALVRHRTDGCCRNRASDMVQTIPFFVDGRASFGKEVLVDSTTSADMLNNHAVS